ncbi:MAG: hypothetical protein V2A53_07480 [bacterium]
MIKFKYRQEIGRVEKIVFRPVADIEFESKNGEWIECHLYIDSGADVTLIPFSLGKLLGLEIDEDKIEEIYGVGKQGIPIIFCEEKVKIGEYTFGIKIAWALIEEIPPLLGRIGIFDHFHINFKQDEGIIEFKWIKDKEKKVKK